MWNEYGYDDDFELEGDEYQVELAAAKAQRRQEETARREREEWDHFVLEINNVIPGPLNDPRLFEENGWW